MSIYRRYSAFNIELANKPSLYDELSNVINLEWGAELSIEEAVNLNRIYWKCLPESLSCTEKQCDKRFPSEILTLTRMLFCNPDETKISEDPPSVALILGQKSGPDLILGPILLTPVTRMSLRQFSAVSWVQR